MRTATLLVTSVLLLAACGSSPSSGTSSIETVAPTTVVDTTTTARTTEVPPPSTTVPGTKPSQEELPVAPPDDPTSVTDASAQRIIASALLVDDAFPPPWEPQLREVDRNPLPPAPNQTTCPPFGALDSLLGRGGGLVMWWVDGGNANQYVTQFADAKEAFATLDPIATIPETCPVVKWIEGGSFTTELIPLADGLGLRFVDEGGDVTVVVITRSGDLVSTLSITLWPATDGTIPEPTTDELNRLASRMFVLLRDAATAGTAPSTTVPVPAIEPPPTTEAPAEPTGLGALLLTEPELPDGWTLDDVDPYGYSGGNDDLIEMCPAGEAIERIDRAFTWEAEFRTPAGIYAGQLIGDMGSPDAAAGAVEEFALMAECDLAELIPGATWTGGLEDVPGADRAARLVFEIDNEFDGGRFELMVFAVDSVIVALSTESTVDEPSPTGDLATRAAAKVAAGR